MTPLVFDRPPRSRVAIVVLLAVWVGILALWRLVEAADWIIAAMLLLTLPAAWDFASGRRAGLRLGDGQLTWYSGRQKGEVALHRLTSVRFERRLDMTVRVRLVTDSGKRIRIPQDALPPDQEFEQALQDHGVRTERHPFALL